MRKIGKSYRSTISVIFCFCLALSLAAWAATSGFVVTTPTILSAANLREVAITDPVVLQNSGIDFSFARTIGQILTTANVPAGNTAANREAIVQTMIDSFAATSAINPASKIAVPLTSRPGEAAMVPADLLDPLNPDGMRPVGVFNRLDLAPADWSNCGEYRIVYAKGNPVSLTNRFMIIFEAVVDNPLPGIPMGCMQIAQFWQSFGTLPNPPRHILAELLESFFYYGIQGTNGPVISFKNLGNPFGQVRGNLFVNNPDGLWDLREWLVQMAPLIIKFAMHPVRNTPMTTLYGTSQPTDANAVMALRTAFQKDFLNIFSKQLTSIDMTGRTAPVKDTALYFGLGDSIPMKYDGFESISNQDHDDPVRTSNQNFQFTTNLQNSLNAQGLPWSLTSTEVIGRAATQGCGGCHNFTPPSDIAPGSKGGVVPWPNSGPFTHINENGALSQLLVQRFLPARFTNFNNYITNTFANPLAGSAPAPATAMIQAATVVRNAVFEVRHSATPQQQINAAANGIDQVRENERNQAGAFTPFRPAD